MLETELGLSGSSVAMDVIMALILNGISEHVAHVVWKTGLFKDIQICDHCRSIKCLKQIKLPNSRNMSASNSELPYNFNNMDAIKYLEEIMITLLKGSLNMTTSTLHRTEKPSNR